MKILLLCHYDPFNAAMVTDHIDAFSTYSLHDVYVHRTLLSNQGNLEEELDLDWFDVIIVHYSIFIGVDAYLSPRSKRRLQNARGVKIVFLQDEYRFVQDSIDGMLAIKADVVYTCVPDAAIPVVYNDPRLRDITFINTLTGYVPDILTKLVPLELKKRKYHVSYRGRKYPDWHGSMGREKYEIAEKFSKAARGKRLKTNISTRERHRVYGDAWTQLIRNSWAVLGVESGASVFDFSGEISAKTETRRALLGRKGISYEALREQYFADVENTIDLAQISPRVFEAMALRTMCILFEGSYSGLLEPDTHYLMLKKDFSNVETVINRLKDPVYVSEVVANSYFDIALSRDLSYKSFIGDFDTVIKTHAAAKNQGIQHVSRGDAESEKALKEKNLAVLAQIEQSTPAPASTERKVKSLAQAYLPQGLKRKIKRLIRS